MKSDNEIWNLYENKEYEALSTAELQRLKALIELKQFEKEVKVDIPSEPDIVKQESSPNNEKSYWTTTIDYKNFHEEYNTTDVNIELREYFNYTDSDAGCSDAQLRDNWSVDQNFVSDIILGAIVKQPLFDACRAGWNVEAGKNARIDIRIAGTWANPQDVSACTCLSCSTQTYQSYSIVLKQLGMYGVACSFDEYKIGGAYKKAILDSMMNRWNNYFGAQIFSALSGANAGYSETLNNTLDCNGSMSGSCCTHGADLYQRILDLDARMREAGLEPTHVIMSPTIANYLKYPQQAQSMIAPLDVKIDNGVISKLGHLKVIEYAGATTCSSATATTFAWVICKDRSLGHAFGKAPTAEFQRDAECNSVKIVMWSYWNCGVLDAGSIGAVLSPNS